jgi:hypothetical protein
MRRTLLVSAVASVAWLAACVASVPAAGVAMAADLRVLVKLRQPSEDGAAIAAQVSAAAGTTARYLAASSPQWHALMLQCADVQTCEAAFLRLGANQAAFEAVQRDERKRIVTP